MRLVRIRAKNVYTFKEVDIDLNRFALTQVIGENFDEKVTVDNEEESVFAQNGNGVGKTNIYNIILQALYSRDINKTKKAYLSNIYSNNTFSITLDLIVDSDILQVLYTNTDCSLFINQVLSISGRQVVTDYFEDIIPAQLFIYLTYLSNTVYFPFFTATNKESQHLITTIFSELMLLKERLPLLKEEISKKKKDVIKLQSMADTLKEIAQQVPLQFQKFPIPPRKDFDEDDLVTWKAQLTVNLQNMRKIEQLKASQSALRIKYKEILAQIDLIDTIGLVHEEEELADSKSQESELIGQNKVLIEERNKVQKALEVSSCPFCFQDINKDTLLQKLEERRNQINQNSATLTGLEEVINKLSILIKDSKKLDQQLANLVTTRDGYIDEGTRVGKDLATIEVSACEIETLKSGIADYTDRKSIYEQKYKDYLEDEKKVTAHNSYQEAVQKQIEEAGLKVLKVTQDLTAVTKELAQLALLFTICSEDILLAQIPSRLKVLEQFINRELSEYTSQYQIQLKMEKEKVQRFIIKQEKQYPVSNLSRGEHTRINLALVFAIKNIFKALNKTQYEVDFVFVDEVFGTLDYSGRCTLLNHLEGQNMNTFVVSHSEELEDKPILKLERRGNMTGVKYYGK